MNTPDLRPSTSRLGGGLSARLLALALAGMLAAVVWIGASGRSPAPSARPAPALADLSTEETPTNSPATGPIDSPSTAPTRPPRTTSTPWPAATPQLAPEPIDGFEITGTVGGYLFRAPLVEVQPGRLSGQFWLPDRPIDDELAFALAQVWRADAARQHALLGTWRLSLFELASNHRAGREALAANVSARPRKSRAPRPIQRGYTLQVSVRLTFDDVAVVDFDMRLGPERQRIRR